MPELGRISVRSLRSGRKSPQSCIRWPDAGLQVHEAQLTLALPSPMLPREQRLTTRNPHMALEFSVSASPRLVVRSFPFFRFLPAPSRSEPNDGMALLKRMSLTSPCRCLVKNVLIPSLLNRVTFPPTTFAARRGSTPEPIGMVSGHPVPAPPPWQSSKVEWRLPRSLPSALDFF